MSLNNKAQVTPERGSARVATGSWALRPGGRLWCEFRGFAKGVNTIKRQIRRSETEESEATIFD